jgi:hypothetical protein
MNARVQLLPAACRVQTIQVSCPFQMPPSVILTCCALYWCCSAASSDPHSFLASATARQKQRASKLNRPVTAAARARQAAATKQPKKQAHLVMSQIRYMQVAAGGVLRPGRAVQGPAAWHPPQRPRGPGRPAGAGAGRHFGRGRRPPGWMPPTGHGCWEGGREGCWAPCRRDRHPAK